MTDKCPSCGVPWTEHLGMTGTCAKLEHVKKELTELAKSRKSASWILRRIEDLLKEVGE